MSYRNLEIDGKKYQYTVGKTHVHIKGEDIKSVTFKKSTVDNHVVGDRIWIDSDNGDGQYKIEVTPKNIRDVILREYYRLKR